jgi:3-(3-hydroxy-phenyl)propionate hydroxylase
MKRFDVCVVGFGPTGATAAALLGEAGHSVLVVDRLLDIYDKPRAICIDHEIMRVFQGLGIVHDIAEHIAPYPASEYRGAGGQIIKRLDTAPPPHPLGYAPNLSFLQPPVEKVVRSKAASFPNVQIGLGHELTEMEQRDEVVMLRLKSADGPTQVQARYVIACDGANSTIRGMAGFKLEDLGFDERWLVIDLLVGDEALARLPAVNVQYCEPSRPATHVVGVGNHRRWEIMLLPGEDPAEAMSPAGVWRHLSRWISANEATLWRSAVYRFHALVAGEWRRGRILLAGDSAHQQPPFLGQGMCQGVRDAANIAWKLGLVLSGEAQEELLDTYGTERSNHVRKLTGIIKGLGLLICERDWERALQRDAKLVAEMGGEVKTTIRQDLMPRLEQGALSGRDHPAMGTVFPQPCLTSGLLLDEAVGAGFRLMVTDLLTSSVLESLVLPPIVRIVRFCVGGKTASDRAYLNVEERDGIVSAWFARHGVLAALVRPDHYVFGVAVDIDSLVSLCGELREKLFMRKSIGLSAEIQRTERGVAR